MNNQFTMSQNTEYRQNMQNGINQTIQHLNNTLLQQNQNENKNKNKNKKKRNYEEMMDQNQLQIMQNSSKRSNLNNTNNVNNDNDESTFIPTNIDFNNISDIKINDDVIDNLKCNLKEINDINDNIQRISTMQIADKLTDKKLNEYLKEYKVCYNNYYDLRKITFKMQLYISAKFIPKHERLKLSLNEGK